VVGFETHIVQEYMQVCGFFFRSQVWSITGFKVPPSKPAVCKVWSIDWFPYCPGRTEVRITVGGL